MSWAQGTAFTYQGRLAEGGRPADGVYDFRFAVYDALSNGTAVAGPRTNISVALSNGLFTVILDFGAGVFTGPPRWLEIGVRTNGSADFLTLSPRQALTAAPYAILAGDVTVTNLARVDSGTPNYFTGANAFTNPSNTFTGTFNGSAAGLSNVNATALGGLGAGAFWQTAGNAGTMPGPNFLGTTDNQPLEIKAGGVRALRLEPDPRGDSAGNLIGGYFGNSIEQPNSGGDVIGGGGYGGGVNLIYSNSSGVFIGAGSANQIGPDVNDAFIGAGYGNNLQSFQSVIAGGYNNMVLSSSADAVIGGGFQNSVQASSAYSTIAGGSQNKASGQAATVGGGANNLSLSNYATVSGGWFNASKNVFSSVGGGYQNSSGNYASTIAGGYQNTNSAAYGSVGGGSGNSIGVGSDYATVAGGWNNRIQTGAVYAAIGGGLGNVIQTNLQGAVISGGLYNSIQAGSGYAVIGGGYGSVVWSNTPYATISGGQVNTIQTGANVATIGGGGVNVIHSNASFATIGGGGGNGIEAGSSSATIGGGNANIIQSNSYYATIAGGNNGLIQSNSPYATLVGGERNQIQNNSADSFVGGGYNNVVQTNSGFSAIVAGAGNTVQASASSSFIGSGQFNAVGTNANLAVIGGGYGNLCGTNYATVPGGFLNSALGEYSLAAGRNALASGFGSFVWNSYPNTNYPVGDNEFFVFAQNGFSVDYNTQTSAGGGSRWVYIGNGRAGSIINPVYTTIAAWNQAYLSDGGTWTSSSDRARKENFAPVDTRAILDEVVALPLQTWNYTNEPATMRHLGPTAQDFHRAFGLNGPDDKHITDIDEGGVALAAIQGLNQKVEEQLKAKDIRLVALEGALAPVGRPAASLSDREAKRDLRPVDGRDVLERLCRIPISTWTYRSEEQPTRHIGPMAQDFHAAFGLGEDDKHITNLDADGVALAAIQGLNQRVRELKQELQARDRKIEALEQRLVAVESALGPLAEKKTIPVKSTSATGQ